MALSAGQDPDEISMADGMLMAMAMTRVGRAPRIADFFSVDEAPFGRFGVSRTPAGIRTTVAQTAEDFEMLANSGWAVRGEEAAA